MMPFFPPALGPVTVLWSMIVATVLTLGIIYALVKYLERDFAAGFVYLLLALSIMAMAGIELVMMRTQNPATYGLLQRWHHVPTWTTFISLAWFAKNYFPHIRPTLVYMAVVTRTVSLIINFYSPVNINYRSISHLAQIEFLGDVISVAKGVPNPWMALAQLSFLLVLIYSIQSALLARQSKAFKQALVISFCLFALVSGGLVHIVFMFWLSVDLPMTASPYYLAVAVAMGVGLINDVVASRRAALALDHERSMITTVFENAPGLMTIWRQDGTIVRWSNKVAQVSGLTAEQIRRRQSIDWVPEKDRPRLIEAIMKTFVEGYAEDRYDLLLANGETAPFFLSAVPVTLDQKPHLIVYGLDMRETNRLESEVERQQRILAHANRVSMMGALATSITHEINQPLTSILANAECNERLMDGAPAKLDQMRLCTRDIISECRRAGQIVNNLRAFMTQSSADREVMDLNELVASVIRLVNREAGLRHIEIVTSLSSGSMPVKGDPVQLRQMVLNLVMNGLDAVENTQTTTRRIRVITSRGKPDVAVLEVAGPGCGLPNESLAGLFDPAIITTMEGAGVGLPVARMIVEAHGGKIHAYNNRHGEETLVRVELFSGTV